MTLSQRTIRIDTRRIADFADFHRVFAETMGFPDFYGKNMDAWIDCMRDLRDDTGMTSILLGPDEILGIEVPDAEEFRKRFPEIFEALVDCAASVNRRFLRINQPPAISLVLH